VIGRRQSAALTALPIRAALSEAPHVARTGRGLAGFSRFLDAEPLQTANVYGKTALADTTPRSTTKKITGPRKG